jgi:hypothetical protein
MANQQEFDALQRALRDPVWDSYREKADRSRRRSGRRWWRLEEMETVGTVIGRGLHRPTSAVQG